MTTSASRRLAHFPDIKQRTFKLERGCSRDHIQSRDMCQRVYDFFADSIAKILLVWLWTHVEEWQHGNRHTARFDCGSDLFAALMAVSSSQRKMGTYLPGRSAIRTGSFLPAPSS